MSVAPPLNVLPANISPEEIYSLNGRGFAVSVVFTPLAGQTATLILASQTPFAKIAAIKAVNLYSSVEAPYSFFFPNADPGLAPIITTNLAQTTVGGNMVAEAQTGAPIAAFQVIQNGFASKPESTIRFGRLVPYVLGAEIIACGVTPPANATVVISFWWVEQDN